MLSKFLDWIFPKYTLEWDFIQNGMLYKSYVTYTFDSLGAAIRAANTLDAVYGKGLHHVKDKDGKIVY